MWRAVSFGREGGCLFWRLLHACDGDVHLSIANGCCRPCKQRTCSIRKEHWKLETMLPSPPTHTAIQAGSKVVYILPADIDTKTMRVGHANLIQALGQSASSA